MFNKRVCNVLKFSTFNWKNVHIESNYKVHAPSQQINVDLICCVSTWRASRYRTHFVCTILWRNEGWQKCYRWIESIDYFLNVENHDLIDLSISLSVGGGKISQRPISRPNVHHSVIGIPLCSLPFSHITTIFAGISRFHCSASRLHTTDLLRSAHWYWQRFLVYAFSMCSFCSLREMTWDQLILSVQLVCVSANVSTYSTKQLAWRVSRIINVWIEANIIQLLTHLDYFICDEQMLFQSWLTYTLKCAQIQPAIQYRIVANIT